MGGCDRSSRPARALLRVGFADAAARGPARGGSPRLSRRRQRARRVARPRHRRRRHRDRRPARRVEAVLRPWADAVWLQGQRFGTVGCTKDGERFEVTTFRAEVYRPESRKPEVAFRRHRDRSFGARLHGERDGDRLDDAGPARNSSTPFGGLTDLGARRLRTPISPEISFEDDPLRMLRGGALRRHPRLRTRARGGRRDRADARAAEDRRGRAHSRRAVEADRRRRPVPTLDQPRTRLSDEFLPD